MKTKRSCFRCKYMAIEKPYELRDRKGVSMGEMGGEGTCRRNPPYSNGEFVYWPRVNEKGWCGEFKRSAGLWLRKLTKKTRL